MPMVRIIKLKYCSNKINVLVFLINKTLLGTINKNKNQIKVNYFLIKIGEIFQFNSYEK